MIKATIQFSDAEAIRRLGAFASELPATLMVAARSFAQKVTSDTVTKKLSGQALNRVTGGLQRAVIAAQKVYRSGEKIGAAVGVSRLSYGVWHEEGYVGPETIYGHSVKPHEVREHAVREHQRRLKSGGSTSVAAHQVRSHQMGWHWVRQHVAQRNIPAKRFVENTLMESLDAGTRRFNKALAILARTGKMPSINALRGV